MALNINGFRITDKQAFDLFEIYMGEKHPVLDMVKYLLGIFDTGVIIYHEKDFDHLYPRKVLLITLAEAKGVADKLIDKWSL